VFILIVQLFMKVSWLKALAPTQTEGPFKLTPLVVIVAFVVPRRAGPPRVLSGCRSSVDHKLSQAQVACNLKTSQPFNPQNRRSTLNFDRSLLSPLPMNELHLTICHAVDVR
jgi:hypothetical protein